MSKPGKRKPSKGLAGENLFDGSNYFEVNGVEYLKLKRAFRIGDIDLDPRKYPF